MEVRKMLEKNYAAIVGITIPLTIMGDDSDKALARSILEGNIMAATFTGTSFKFPNGGACMLPEYPKKIACAWQGCKQ